jgi:hypothetical protein
MPKKTLVEREQFIRLLSNFSYIKEMFVWEKLDKLMSKYKNPVVQNAYDKWKKSSDEMMDATYFSMIKSGVSEEEALKIMNKYTKYTPPKK